MVGEPIVSVKVGLDAMLASLRSDPFALESANISIITYDRIAQVVLPLTPLEDIQLPEITCPQSGPTMTGAALKLLCEQVDKEVVLSTPTKKGDWMPLLFIMTDGKPSDIMDYNMAVPEVKKRKFASIIACAAGAKAKTEPLQQLTDQVYTLDSMDSGTFAQFFKWVSSSIGVGNRSVGSSEELTLPAPPQEVNLVI